MTHHEFDFTRPALLSVLSTAALLLGGCGPDVDSGMNFASQTASETSGADNDTAGTADDGMSDGENGDGDSDASASDTESDDSESGPILDVVNGEEGDDCFEETLTFNGEPPSVMLVLDQSDSMNIDNDHDNNPATPAVSRWQALHEALVPIVNTYDDSAEFGVQLFPNDGDCGVAANPEVLMAPNNAATILSTVPGPTSMMSGLTPSGTALQAAIDHLGPYDAAGKKAIIYMADGDVTCGMPNSNAGIASLLADAYNGGVGESIATYVVGMKSVNQFDIPDGPLSDLAVAGGVPQMGLCTDTDWVVDTSDQNGGSFSMHSGAIGASETSTITLEVDLATAGNLQFDVRTDTESGGDLLRLWVDGLLNSEYTGTQAWHSSVNVALSAGSHQITFRYRKNETVNVAPDRVWVDNVVITGSDINEGFESGDFSGANWGQGKPCPAYYAGHDTDGLYDALDQIVSGLVSCTIDLDPAPLEEIEVTVGGTMYDELNPDAPGFDCAVDSGWYFVDPDTIELCGGACGTFETLDPPTLDVTYFCNPD
jgi:hypothetical protein